MNHLLSVAAAHPIAALALVAVVACAESLAVIGTFVPAAIVMFAAGALVGSDVLPLWPTVLLAAAGAVLGDAISFEIGRHHESSLSARVFAKHPQLARRGEQFIRRHGARSVVLARFTGPVRALVPLLLGVTRMPRRRFYAINVVSALLWALTHIMPGVVFGGSLQVAEAVSGRLALLLVLLAMLAWVVVSAVLVVGRVGLPWLRRLRDAAVARSRERASAPARLVLALLDPQRPGSHALLLGAALLVAAGWLFLGVVEDVVSHDPLVHADLSVNRFLQALRTASIDRWMVAITELGSVGVMFPLALAVLAWLVLHRAWRSAGYWLAAIAFGEVLVQVLKLTLGRDRPSLIYSGIERFSFPSGHATFSTIVLAFLAFLVSRGRPVRSRVALAAVVSVVIVLIAFSRLMLGAHWLSDVLGGMSLGLVWVALLAMVYTQRQVREDFSPNGLLVVALGSMFVFGAVWHAWRGAADIVRYTPGSTHEMMTTEAWLEGQWRRLPLQRHEFAGDPEERFRLQWACGATLLVQRLDAAGWRRPTPWSWRSALGALAPKLPLTELPVLPRFDRGQRSNLTFIHGGGDPDQAQRLVLRLWRSDFEIATAGDGPSAKPIWYGTVYREARDHKNAFFGIVRQSDVPADPLRSLLPADVQVQPRTTDGVSHDSLLLLLCSQ